MEDTKHDAPAPPLATRGSIRPDAALLADACGLVGYDRLTAIFSDAPTALPTLRIIEQMQSRTATGYITDADAARAAQDDGDAHTLARLLESAQNEVAVLTEQRESLIRQNVAMLNAERRPFLELADRFDMTQAVEALQFAQYLEAQGIRCALKTTRDERGVIDGLGVWKVGAAVVVADEPVVMATDGGDGEWKEAA